MSVSERITERRKELGLNQSELARMADLTSAAISQFESGTRKPSFEAIKKLASALKVSTDYLVGEKVKDTNDLFNDPKIATLFRGVVNLSEEDKSQLFGFYSYLLNKSSVKETSIDYVSSGEPKDYALKLLDELDISTIPINPREIARLLNIEVTEALFDDSFDGCLIRGEAFAGIMINKHTQYESRKRFTISHELGHFRIPWHVNIKYECKKHDLGFFTSNVLEREANEFAAELLMPLKFIKPEIERMPLSFKTIHYLKDRYETSFTATGIRVTKFTPEKGILILSDLQGVVKWTSPSNTFSSTIKSTIPKELLFLTSKDDELGLKSDLSYWLHDKTAISQDIYVQTYFVPDYNQVFILLKFRETQN